MAEAKPSLQVLDWLFKGKRRWEAAIVSYLVFGVKYSECCPDNPIKFIHFMDLLRDDLSDLRNQTQRMAEVSPLWAALLANKDEIVSLIDREEAEELMVKFESLRREFGRDARGR